MILLENKKVNIIGDPLGSSGYSIHTRELGLALYKAGFQVSFEFNRPQNWEQTPDGLFQLLFNNFSNETNIFIGLPPWWGVKLSERPKHFIGFLIWESDIIPESWVSICNDKRVDQIWVPSEHSKNACIKSGVSEDKIFVISHGVDVSLFNPDKPGKMLDERFTFLYCKGWASGKNDRGGFTELLTAFLEEFKPDEPVRLFAKLNTVYNPPGWNLNVEFEKAGVLPRLMKSESQVGIMLDNIPYNELPHFYNSGDVFVCPTKGESFGLTIAEAMACGKSTISTNWGGQLDFINETNSWLIPYDLIPATGGIFYEGQQWAMPKHEELKKLLRYAYDHKDEVKFKGKKALENIQQFTWEKTTEKARNALMRLP